MNPNLLTLFIAVTSVAVVLQMIILAAMYFTTRKTTQRLEALAAKVEGEAMPLVVQVRGLVEESGPKVREIITNVSETSTIVRAQVQQIDTVVTDIVGRTRSQVERADALVTKTLTGVERTAETVQQSVLSPVRRVTAVLDGIIAGFGEFIGGRKVRRTTRAVPNEEMFI